VDSRAASSEAEENDGATRTSDEPREALEESVAIVTRMGETLRGLARVRAEVLREQVLAAAERGAREIWMAIAGAAATVTAIVLLVRGASDGVAGLFAPDHAWAADLAVGAAVLVSLLSAHLAREALRRRRRLRRLKREMEPQS